MEEDLVICEYCDQGVHYSCLNPPPEKRPKVWDCDDCLIARGKPPNNNVKKRTDVVLLGPPSLAPAEHTKEPSLSRFSDLLPPELHPKDKRTHYDTIHSDDSSGSSGSESDSEENSLAPPKLAPSNQDNPIFNDLLKNLNNIKSGGKNEILTPAEITLKEEASIEYSSGNNSDEDSEDSEDEDESSQQEEEPQKKPKTEIPSIVVSPAAAAAASIFSSKKAKIPEISVPNITKKAEIISITKKKTPTVTVESTPPNATTEDEEVQGA